jgi:hypothetical protein
MKAKVMPIFIGLNRELKEEHERKALYILLSEIGYSLPNDLNQFFYNLV